jgi:hypothetical protein
VFVWLDDNLGTKVLWELLTPEQIDYMATFPKHSRACCFKGYDQVSFSFNTGSQNNFDKQFTIFERLLRSDFDLYAYATITSPKGNCTKEKMKCFVDRLQMLHPNLPLRTIPLEIKPFTNTTSRMDSSKLNDSFMEQQKAYDFSWNELIRRFTQSELTKPYDKVSLS